MTRREPTDQFLAEVRRAVENDGGQAPQEPRHFLDGLNLRGYTLGNHLGTGSAGAVYEATDPKGNKVAVKVLPLPEGDSAAKIFQREVKIGQTIDHPSIVKTLHTFDLGPAQFVIMELVEGSTLKTVLRGEPLEPKWFYRIFEPLAEGLEVAHSKGVVHRDLKPENIMLAADGAIKILDFGMARLVEDASVTMTGTFKGTVRYTAPEQLSDSKRAGPACDQFALGLLMFEGLTGKFPYPEHKQPMQAVLDRAQNDPWRLSQVDSRFPEEASAVFARMLAREPEDRYAGVLEAYNALKAAITRT